MQPVSYTAKWTAAIRALESERGADALFADDLARRLSEPYGLRLIDRPLTAFPSPSIYHPHGWRTAWRTA